VYLDLALSIKSHRPVFGPTKRAKPSVQEYEKHQTVRMASLACSRCPSEDPVMLQTHTLLTFMPSNSFWAVIWHPNRDL
jgi:hypothetical protein